MDKLYIIGFMGAGKTTIGKELSKLLKCSIYDTDVLIELEEGTTIAEIFANKGEEYFRKKETEILQRTEEYKGIITTGGGIIGSEVNQQLLKKLGFTIFLQCDPLQMVKRIQNDPTRPLARNKSEREMINLYQSRLPYYKESADMIIDTTNLSIPETLKKLEGCIQGLELGNN